MECPVCLLKFRDSYNLNRHLKIHDKPNVIQKSRLCPLCKLDCKYLHNHLCEVHNVILQKHNIEFCSRQEFISWKEKTEQETKSRYVKHSGSLKRKDGSVCTYYYCHRDGDYIPKGKNVRCRKMFGSNKIQASCPAYIRTTEHNNGNVSAYFISTHVGHSCEITRMTLTVSEREKLAKQIAMKIPFEDILQGIRNTKDKDNLKRIHLTTKRDLRNLINQFGLDSGVGVFDTNDLKTLDQWIHFMNENGNAIRLYKPKGMKDTNFPTLEEDDFCLIFANEEQLIILKNFGNDILCVDGIYGSTGYDYHLFTIIVLDEKRIGFPCGFMFSNRCDCDILALFYKTIIENAGCHLSPKYIMTDINDIFLEAWTFLFPENTVEQLYSAFYVDKMWKQNLMQIKSEERQIEIYKRMRILMLERDRNEFHAMSEILLNELYNSELTHHFAKFFDKLICDPSKWAYSYRHEIGLITDAVIESVHRNLKHIYQAGKRGKNLLKSIHALQKFLGDLVFRKTNWHYKGNLAKKLLCLKKRHQISLELSADSIISLAEDAWTVISGTEMYSVFLDRKECNCELRCEECIACVHSFSCTCADSAVFWNMCKHIHLVCRTLSVHDVNVLQVIDEYPAEENMESESSLKNEDVIIIQVLQNEEKEHVEESREQIMMEIVDIVNTEVVSKNEFCRMPSVDDVHVLQVIDEYPAKQNIENEASVKDEDVIIIQVLPNEEEGNFEVSRQQSMLEIVNIVNTEVKSEKGLEALRTFISPLKDVIRSAEDGSGQSSLVLNEELPNKIIYEEKNGVYFEGMSKNSGITELEKFENTTCAEILEDSSDEHSEVASFIIIN